MKKKVILLFVLATSLIGLLSIDGLKAEQKEISSPEKSHWFILHRKSGIEYLYYGKMGDVNNSRLVKTFQVKSGMTGSSPTPLPSLLGWDYWLIIKKESSMDNPETAPYFLTLNIPVSEEFPFGPVPYPECGGQCDWVIPGYFGLHGVNGNSLKLSKNDLGSSGCIRHSDEDITYLFNLLDPEKEEIRYYIEDI
ncbi:MAG: L,D-transpeptidase [Candidatus Levybacteria bacterium]|nr:L,D-transpeptidase [Candidatus Levybacteria bacterium]